MKKLSLQSILNTGVAVIAFVCVGTVLSLNLIYTASIAYDASEKVTVTVTPLLGVLMLLAALVIAFLTGIYRKYADRMDTKKLFWIFTAVYSVAALYLILNVDGVIRADAGAVYNAALGIRNETFSDFQAGGYCQRYPHQLGLVLYDSILQLFSENTKFMFIANFCFIIAVNYVSYKISHLLFEDKLTDVVTVTVSFAFLPQLFFILFAYGLIPGLFFMLLAFYSAIKLSRDHKAVALICTVVFSAPAVLLKKNYLIGAVAILIYLMITLKKEKAVIRLVAAAGVIAACVLPAELVKSHYENVSGQELNGGTPSILWVAMGTDLDNTARAPGWYDGSVYQIYADAQYDSDTAAKIGMEKLKDNLDRIMGSDGEAFGFFFGKAVSVWCEPTYQSIWSGPLEDCGQYTHTELLRDMYTGGGAAQAISVFCKFINVFILGFAAVFLVMCRGGAQGWQIAFMFFVGGLLFHTAWEGKSQYVYPYVYALIPFASYAFAMISKRLGDAAGRGSSREKATDLQ